MTRLTCEEVRELTPLLALNVLDVDEQDVVEDHLAGCVECQRELAAYAEVAAKLALALPQVEPSPELKGRVLAQARRPRAIPAPPLAVGSSRLAFLQQPKVQRLVLMFSALAAAGAIVVAAGTTYWALSVQALLDHQNAQMATLSQRANNYQRVAAVLQAADTQVRVLNSTNQAEAAFGRVYIDPETSEGMLMVRNLPPLPQGRVYQLWVARANGERESAGLLTWTDRQGNGYTLIKCPETLARWNTFGVTEEPAGGSNLPTGPRVLDGAI